MKRITQIIILLALLLPVTASAYDFGVNGIYYNITSSTNMTAAVTYYSMTDNTYSGTITIPEKVTHDGKTYYVTAIGESAFVGCTGLKKVNFSSQRITSIGNYAFQGCNGITSFVIPPQITSIGKGVFNGCYGMTGLTIEESEESLWLGCNYEVTVNATSLGKGLFYDCPLYSVFIGRPLSYSTNVTCGYSPFANNKTLVKAHFGNPVKSIQSRLFSGCSSLKTLVYNSQCKPTAIEYCAFCGCTALTELDIHYPESVKTIGDYAFENCSSISSYTIPNHVTAVGAGAFMSCTRLSNVIIKPSVTSIGNYAFNGCTALTGVTIEESETPLSLGFCYEFPYYGSNGKGLFYDCPLYSVFIGRPLSYTSSQERGYSPFANNTNLVKARLGKKLSSIPNKLFYGCVYLNEVTSCAATPPTANANCFANYNATLYVPKSSVSAYKNATVWKDFYSIIGIDIVDDVIPGDVNGDSKVNITDVTDLIDYLLSGDASAINLAGADCNQDGSVNISDVTALIDYLLSGHWN